MRLLAILVVTFMSLGMSAGQSYDSWIETVDSLGSTIQFTCSKPGIHPEDRTFTENATAQRWLLPNLKFLNPNETDGTVSVSEDGTNLTVVNIAQENLGLYHCLLLTPNNATRMVKWGLNMKGPYFVNMWDKYRTNVIIACSAFGGFLVLVAIVYATWRFRWTPPPGWNETKAEKDINAAHEMAESSPAAGGSNEHMPYPMAPRDPNPAIPQYEMPPAAVVGEASQSPPPYSPKEVEAGLAASAVVNAASPVTEAEVTVEVAKAAAVGGYDNMAATKDDGQALSTTAL